ncbi:MAG: ABC transporter ATP-binding protein [Polaromonas sp.]|nr:ABC transporter ATP-binding protein [Polaromonas sp.]
MTRTGSPAPAGRVKVEVDRVGLSYYSRRGETLALEDISFSVDTGEFVSLIGPSGCGKSTLLSLIAGLSASSTGSIRIDGAKVEGTSASVGYMLQQDYLLEWRSILDNVLLGAEILGRKRADVEPYAIELLRTYGLGQFLSHRPAQLSGGMRQRAALARTMVTRPELILLDEPFSALDSQTRLAMADDMVAILREAGKTVILVTHDIAEAIAMTDRALVLTRRPGRIKSEHRFDWRSQRADGATPLQIRSLPEFHAHFGRIWNELDEHTKG